ncbi:MAG: type VI secretion system tip protein VgrG, partial [Gibbsiella quercinecans]
VLKTPQNILLAAGQSISLVSGDSMLTLDHSGTVSIQCVNIQINASGQGEINTGGTLDLNIKQPAKAKTPPPTPADITNEVNSVFKKSSGSDA